MKRRQISPYADDEQPLDMKLWRSIRAPGPPRATAGVLGLLFSFFQIQKTRLEVRKLTLELREKETSALVQLSLRSASIRQGWYVVLFLFLATAVSGCTIIYFYLSAALTISQTKTLLLFLLPVFIPQLYFSLLLLHRRNILVSSGITVILGIAVPLITTAALVVTMFSYIAGWFFITFESLELAVALCATALSLATAQIMAGIITITRTPISVDDG